MGRFKILQNVKIFEEFEQNCKNYQNGKISLILVTLQVTQEVLPKMTDWLLLVAHTYLLYKKERGISITGRSCFI